MDLEVQTELLRQAADVVEDASTAFTGDGTTLRSELAHHSLGQSVAAREVVTAATRRVQHDLEAARRLGDLTRDIANTLRTVAVEFEIAENSAIAGPR